VLAGTRAIGKLVRFDKVVDSTDLRAAAVPRAFGLLATEVTRRVLCVN